MTKLKKEIAVALITGLVWGCVIAAIFFGFLMPHPHLAIRQDGQYQVSLRVEVPVELKSSDKEKLAQLQVIADTVKDFDLPRILKAQSDRHRNLAHAWNQNRKPVTSLPFGSNMIELQVNRPCYAAEGPKDENTEELAGLLNKQVDAALTEGIAKRLNELKRSHTESGSVSSPWRAPSE